MKNDCVERNYESMEAHLKNTYSRYRIKTIKKFMKKQSPSLDIGCGAFMPKVLGTTEACDYNDDAKAYLKKVGWKGKFKVGDLKKKLPYKKKEFEVAVCSEVIEHLRSLKQVANAFLEIDRVAKRWIVTTPSVYIPDKDHKLFFCSGNIYDAIPFDMSYFVVINKGPTFYISNDIKTLRRLLL